MLVCVSNSHEVADHFLAAKLQIIFHKRATKYRSLLRKMTYKMICNLINTKGTYENIRILSDF